MANVLKRDRQHVALNLLVESSIKPTKQPLTGFLLGSGTGEGLNLEQAMENEDSFEWTYPAYALSPNAQVDADGNLRLDNDPQFITPEQTPNGERSLAIFTDLHLAEQYRARCDPELSLRVVRFADQTALTDFLRLATARYLYVAVDLNQSTLRSQTFLIEKLIQRWS